MNEGRLNVLINSLNDVPDAGYALYNADSINEFPILNRWNFTMS